MKKMKNLVALILVTMEARTKQAMTKEAVACSHGEKLPQASLKANALMSNVPSVVNSGMTTVLLVPVLSGIVARTNQSTGTLVHAAKKGLIMKVRTSV